MGRIRRPSQEEIISPLIRPPHVRPVGEEKERICKRMRDVLGHLTEELKDLQSRRRGIGIELMDAEREMMKVCEESVMTNECWDAQQLVMTLRDDLERIDRDIELLKREIERLVEQMEDFGCERVRWVG